MLLKKSKLFSAVICVITALSVLLFAFPQNSTRAVGNDKSITLVCVSGDTVLKGMTWRLYKVGARTSNGMNFVQTGDFSAIQVNLRRLTEERVNEAAQTFQSYAIANQINPLKEGQTNENGEVTFTGLDAGLYLLTGKLLKIETNYYVPTTALIEIKDDDTDLKYDAYPKFEYQVANAMPRHYFAYKRWEDEGHLNERPDHVIFDIYKDEEYYESVVLNEENNWTYDWIDDEGVSVWIVMERDIPEKYAMRLEYDRARFFIHNTYTEEEFFTTTTTTTSKSNQTTTTTTTYSGPMGDGSATRSTTNVVSGETVTRTGTTTTGTQSGSYTTGTGTSVSTTSGSTGTETGTGTDTSTGTDTNTSTTASGSTSTSKKSSSGGSGSSGSSGKGNGSSSSKKSSGSSNSSSSSRKLPQTGQLWWPVVPLSISGVLLVGAGLVIRARRKED